MVTVRCVGGGHVSSSVVGPRRAVSGQHIEIAVDCPSGWTQRRSAPPVRICAARGGATTPTRLGWRTDRRRRREHNAGMSPPRRLRGRTRRDLLVGALVLSGLVVFVLVTYVVIVVGGGVLFGHVASPQLGLSVLATAAVALAFDPVQRRLQAVAAGMVDGGRPAPYEVLRRFSETVTGSYPAEQLPARMARVLADGTGAEWAQVWVTVGGTPTLAATWPPGAAYGHAGDGALPAAPDGGVRSMPVRHSGELLGLLVVKLRQDVSLTSVEERLFAGLAGQAGLVLRGTALRVQLGQWATELAARAD